MQIKNSFLDLENWLFWAAAGGPCFPRAAVTGPPPFINRNSLQYRERAEVRFYVILCNSRTASHRKFNFEPFCSPKQPVFKKYFKIYVLYFTAYWWANCHFLWFSNPIWRKILCIFMILYNLITCNACKWWKLQLLAMCSWLAYKITQKLEYFGKLERPP